MAFKVGQYVRIVNPGLDANHPNRDDLPVGAAGEVTKSYESRMERCVNITVTGFDPVFNQMVTHEYIRIPERCLAAARS